MADMIVGTALRQNRRLLLASYLLSDAGVDLRNEVSLADDEVSALGQSLDEALRLLASVVGVLDFVCKDCPDVILRQFPEVGEAHDFLRVHAPDVGNDDTEEIPTLAVIEVGHG